MDVCAARLGRGGALIEDGEFDAALADRYAGWDKAKGKAILARGATLE